MTVIAEKTQSGIPVQMVLESDNTISILGKKCYGKKRDGSHDIENCYEVNPFMAEEIRSHRAEREWLASFIMQMWEIASDLDPFYFQAEEDYDDDELPQA